MKKELGGDHPQALIGVLLIVVTVLLSFGALHSFFSYPYLYWKEGEWFRGWCMGFSSATLISFGLWLCFKKKKE